MIEVIRQKDNLNREVWEFRLFGQWFSGDNVLILERYKQQERPSTRHRNWRMVTYYERLGRGSYLKVFEVPLPDDVKQEALENFVKTLKVVREHEKDI